MNKYSVRLYLLAGLLLTLSILSDSPSMGFVFGITWGLITILTHAKDS